MNAIYVRFPRKQVWRGKVYEYEMVYDHVKGRLIFVSKADGQAYLPWCGANHRIDDAISHLKSLGYDVATLMRFYELQWIRVVDGIPLGKQFHQLKSESLHKSSWPERGDPDEDFSLEVMRFLGLRR
jgi:hypothetical protein